MLWLVSIFQQLLLLVTTALFIRICDGLRSDIPTKTTTGHHYLCYYYIAFAFAKDCALDISVIAHALCHVCLEAAAAQKKDTCL